MGSMAEYETILTETNGRVATITLNRPKALNALNSQLLADVTAAVETFDAQENIGAIVITGGEKAFAAGADIKEMKDETFPEIRDKRLFAEWEKLAAVKPQSLLR